MNYLGIDFGEKRIGLSFAGDISLAIPLPAACCKTERENINVILSIIQERKIHTLVIGYPYNMDGTIGVRAKAVDTFIEKLKKLTGLLIHKTDERLTTRQVESDLETFRFKNKKSIQSRIRERASGKLDSRVATLLLQEYLDYTQFQIKS
jgi:putative holliday junction resolvase